MFESITSSLNQAFRTIAGKAKISEDNITEAVREVRVALLEADVNLEVARDFVTRVKQEALGEKVLQAVDPSEQFVKILHDQLVALLGGEREDISWKQHEPTVIMLCGLQGCGKTTTIAKLASRFKADGRKPLLVGADIQRPAAVQQLRVLGEQIQTPVYSQEGGDPVRICAQALEVAKVQGCDTILLDTAGRLHVDDALMLELENIVGEAKPQEILFVCDAMIGQSAVDTAAEFRKRLPLTGAVMTKLDSDARGGSALSLREVTGVPIKYITVGEKVDQIEEFHPDRMAGRILGMGDIVSLVEKAQDVVDEKEALAMQQKLMDNAFDLNDFLKQMSQLRRMGGLKSLLGLLPGMGALKDLDIDENQFKKIEAIIQSMTLDERKNPEIINGSRRSRVVKGAGCSAKELADLLKQFAMMRKMIGKMGKSGMLDGGMNMLGGMNDMMQAAAGGNRMTGVFGSKKQGTKAQRDIKKERRKQKDKRKRKKRRK